MSGTYVPGFSSHLQRYAGGGLVYENASDADTPLGPSRTSTKPGLAQNLDELAARAAAGDYAGMSPEEARLASQLVEPTYSDQFSGYLRSVNDVIAGMTAPEIGRLYSAVPLTQSIGGAGSGIFKYTPESQLANYTSRPAEQNVGYYATLHDPSKDSLLASGPAGAVKVDYDTPILLVNNLTGEIVAQGVGIQSAQDIVKQAKALSAADGGKANWSVFTGNSGSTDPSTFRQVMYDTPNTTVGDIAKVVAPIALQFIPGLGTALGTSLGLSGTAATMVGTGLTAALGRTGAGIASGDSVLGSIGAGLKTGAISGLTAGALKGLDVGGSGFGSASQIANKTLSELGREGLSSAVASTLPSGLGSGLAALPGATSGLGGLVVEGVRGGLSAAIPSAVAAGAGSLSSAALNAANNASNFNTPRPNTPTTPADPGQIVVNANIGQPVPGLASNLAGATGATGGALANAIPGGIRQPTPQPDTQQPVDQTADPIVVKGLLDKGFTIDQMLAMGIPAATLVAATTLGSSAGATGASTAAPSSTTAPNPSVPETVGANPITVTANPGALTPAQVAAAAALGAGGLGAVATSPNAPVSQPTTPGKSILDQIGDLSTLDKIRLAGLGLGTIGDLFGGGGTQNTGTIPAGLGGPPNPIFSKALPVANLPAAAPRAPQDIDYYRYGYGPQQSFFNNAPQGAANTSTAYTGYAHGGDVGRDGAPVSSFAVGGPGDGREDKIPAMLSDGEYVLDAETVAMLGNGSSKAGAKKLDQFRVNVRKQKGRKLAKGQFSEDAKAPEHYLKGRN